MAQRFQELQLLAYVALLGLLPLAVAHGHDEDMKMDAEVPRPTITASMDDSATTESMSYFEHGGYSGLVLGHILLMVIGWVFVLPIGVMFSISRSRYALATQFLFLALNATGVGLATIYDAKTPDLYPNNAHHKLGWLLTWIVIAQTVMGVVCAYARRHDTRHSERAAFISVSTEAMAEHHQRMEDLRAAETYRFSNDSGQGTEPETESLRSQSISSSSGAEAHQLPDVRQDHAEDSDNEEKFDLLRGSKVDKFLIRKIPGMLSSRALKVIQFIYNVIDRLILILGFVAISTGIVTYGGLFRGSSIFNGLAHFIKGGIFFWYGILTLGRWSGCFAEIGWAWNINPTTSNRPSAEFVESALIFTYGSTNIFLEHLAAWGSVWTAQDLEHLSITIMFIGGGLLGMFIESSSIRNLLNTSIEQTQSKSSVAFHTGEEALEPPRTYKFSMNPIPALIVLLLGLMMSSHHQHSMFSSMIHKQWGTLLTGAAFARAATYIIFYLAPPTSILPGRPPSELLTAFCLMAGGVIFMTSARDPVNAMEAYGLDAMVVLTVTVGIITLLMAWIILVIAIKGWALRKEAGKENGAFAYRSMA